MKKRFLAVILCLSLSIIGASCDNEKNTSNQSTTVDTTSNIVEIPTKHKVYMAGSNYEEYLDESDLYAKEWLPSGFYTYNNEYAKQQINIEFLEIEYVLDYNHSTYACKDCFSVDYYCNDNITIGIDSKTENVVFFENNIVLYTIIF